MANKAARAFSAHPIAKNLSDQPPVLRSPELYSDGATAGVAILRRLHGATKGTDFMGNLKGKRAFVTGASQGIGAAIAEGLIDAGADVCLHYFQSDTTPRMPVHDRTMATFQSKPDSRCRYSPVDSISVKYAVGTMNNSLTTTTTALTMSP